MRLPLGPDLGRSTGLVSFLYRTNQYMYKSGVESAVRVFILFFPLSERISELSG